MTEENLPLCPPLSARYFWPTKFGFTGSAKRERERERNTLKRLCRTERSSTFVPSLPPRSPNLQSVSIDFPEFHLPPTSDPPLALTRFCMWIFSLSWERLGFRASGRSVISPSFLVFTEVEKGNGGVEKSNSNPTQNETARRGRKTKPREKEERKMKKGRKE